MSKGGLQNCPNAGSRSPEPQLPGVGQLRRKLWTDYLDTLDTQNQLCHTFRGCDTSRGSAVLPPCNDDDVSECQLSTFLVLSLHYCISMQAGTAYGEASKTQFDELLPSQGYLLVLSCSH